jgi:hypothetical protein
VARICEAGEERGNDDYKKDMIYGKDGEDVTAKLASLLLRTYSCRRVSRDVRSRR